MFLDKKPFSPLLYKGNCMLRQDHFEELRHAGISDDVIRQAGLYSVTSEEAAVLLGWHYSRSGGLVFPYFDLDGNQCYARVKLDSPITFQEVVSPKGTKQRFYIPPLAWERIQASDDLIVIVVGEKNALSVLTLGYSAIGLPCVDIAKKPKNTGPFEALLENIPLRGREVALLFNSNSATNPHVKRAEDTLADKLVQAGASLLRITLPPCVNGSTQSVDEFLAAAGDEAHKDFEHLLRKEMASTSTF